MIASPLQLASITDLHADIKTDRKYGNGTLQAWISNITQH